MTDRRRAVELLAVLAVLADVTLTRIVVGAGLATETNPVTAWLLHASGYPAWAAGYTTVLVGVLALGRWLDQYGLGWAARIPLALPITLAVANAAGVMATGSWPASVAWGDVGGLVGVVVAIVAITAIAPDRPRVLSDLRARLAAISIPHADRPLVVMSVFLLVLSAVLAGVPASVFGPGAPAESVDRVTAATGLVQDFKDGDASGWSASGGSISAQQTTVFKGSYSALADAGGTKHDYNYDFGTEAPTKMSVAFRVDHFDANTSTPRIVYGDASNSNQPIYMYVTGGNVKLRTSSSVDTGADISKDTWYVAEFIGIDYSADEYNVTIKDTDGNELGSATNVPFYQSAGDLDTFNIYTQYKVWTDN